ncbi:hypothetical protein [Pseudomonas umsongensis]
MSDTPIERRIAREAASWFVLVKVRSVRFIIGDMQCVKCYIISIRSREPH